MGNASREFQIFAKPIGSICNLGCHYCYYLKKEHLYPKGEKFRMSEDILERYIVQHIEASPAPTINFSWHGGEPTLLGINYFRRIVALQRKHRPPNRRITNGIQTNGTLLEEKWCQFFADKEFTVGLSLDGPQELHDQHRVFKSGSPTHEQVIRGYDLLRQHQVPVDLLCVVHAHNVQYPTEVYRFFKQIKAQYMTFLPLVEPDSNQAGSVGPNTMPAESWGNFLCTIFDEWKAEDIEHIKVQIFEEAARTAFNQEHSLCIFRKTCGDIPVIEHNGDFFSCDHFVDKEHRLGNIRETPLVDLLESPAQRTFGQAKWDTLSRYCRACEVLDMCHGGCPKDRILRTPDGQAGLNYLCAGYKRFFTHCRPFVDQLSTLWRRKSLERQSPPEKVKSVQATPKVGRNDPCPCGSGLKYKKCCLGK
ncbi:MAG: anaerobic sulfatase maturase [Thermodesulfobacteriota bacterium]